MDAVTYPSTEVQASIGEVFIPLRLPHDHGTLADAFRVEKTPSIILLGPDGTEFHRMTGFLSPADFLAGAKLGLAKSMEGAGNHGETIQLLESLVQDYPESHAVPEAIYVLGLSRYRSSHEPRHLKEMFEELKSRFPGSEWTRRSFQYRLL